MFKFTIVKRTKKGSFRAGVLKTPHGSIETPSFIPVGTAASVKALCPKDLKEIGVQIVLANTYHLMLRPGADLVSKMGGLSEFMGWKGPTMTDSGGYQVFSLGRAQTTIRQGKFKSPVFLEDIPINKSQKIKPAKVDEDGVTFYSHLDGSKLRIDPKISIGIQEKLGADLIVAFDDHESPLWDHKQVKESLELTNKWALLSLKTQKRKDQLMYGVIHGSDFKDLRIESAKFTNRHFKAIAIGGAYNATCFKERRDEIVSDYKSKDTLKKIVETCIPFMDEDKPRHLLGVGEVEDLFNGVGGGMDFFDCVAPTRRARHGSLYIQPKNGGNAKNNFCLSITHKLYTSDKKPIDPGCLCYTCQNFTRAYLRHLFLTSELLAYQLATYHNVYYITNLMKQIRQAILDDRFDNLKSKYV